MDENCAPEEVYVKQEIYDFDDSEAANSQRNDLLAEDVVKIEADEPNFLPSLIIEKCVPLCSQCDAPFERTGNVKFHSDADIYKCNKCILHSRLNLVFNNITSTSNKNKRRKVAEMFDTSSKKVHKSVLVKKILYLCCTCKKPFERQSGVKLLEKSDWLRCNKCILHSRLNVVFNRNIQGESHSGRIIKQ